MFSILCAVCSAKFWYTLISILVGVYFYVKYSLGYWKRMNIYSPPIDSWKGHTGEAMKTIPLSKRFADIYMENKKEMCVGVYFTIFKQLVINDLDLVKNILAKDYSHFEGHGFKSNKNYDIINQHLFNLEGEEWKKLRVKLTPTFTSSKMKYMFETLFSSNEVMVEYLRDHIKTDNDVDIKEVIAKLGTDVISSCAFGIETNSFKDPDSEFRKMGKKSVTVEWWMTIHDLASLIAPWLTTRLPFSRTPADITNFFSKVVKDMIEYREKNNVHRNDFMQLLMEMKNADKSSANHLSLKEIIAQTFVFFVAGFETSATTVQYALLELIKNPEIRDEVVRHVDEIVDANDGKITYDVVYNSQLLTQVVNETLRMYPPVPVLTRTCTKDYKIPNTNKFIQKGTPVVIPIYGIHNDPDIYPEPEKFCPDRFSPENIKARHQFAHLPFGEGPRICIGSRFGQMQSKLAILTLLRHFNLELSPKTHLPLQYDPKAFLLHTHGELVLKLTERKH